MIPITKRIRSYIMMRELQSYPVTGKILDVGSGKDSYFVKCAREDGFDIQSMDILNGEDFLLLEKTDAKTVTALALLWHINVQQFFERCKFLGVQAVFILQGKNWTEPLTKIYSHNHVHVVLSSASIDSIASFQGYKKMEHKNFLVWDLYFYLREDLVNNGCRL